jgi:hypothetical protein
MVFDESDVTRFCPMRAPVKPFFPCLMDSVAGRRDKGYRYPLQGSDSLT